MIFAHHLILTGHAHWLPNDPRGSYSLRTVSPKLADLAEIHFGRKNPQPSLEELRAFYERAKHLLAHPILWFEQDHRDALAHAIERTVQTNRLTCWACAILHNHIHILVRRHRLSGAQMWSIFRTTCAEKLREVGLCPPDHPVFSDGVSVIFKDDISSVYTCIDYINSNFDKHRLPRIAYPFVQPYSGWPFANDPNVKRRNDRFGPP